MSFVRLVVLGFRFVNYSLHYYGGVKDIKPYVDEFIDY